VGDPEIRDKIPYVGVGCIVVRDGKLLLVCNQSGFWSTPGGHLEFGEAPDVCAAREALEETGITVSNVRFVAITNDVLAELDKHYLTVWMCGDADHAAQICDTAEITDLGWFSPDALPKPLHIYFENLVVVARLWQSHVELRDECGVHALSATVEWFIQRSSIDPNTAKQAV
jgi:8-oxo-dGTP diphosphatase